MQEYCSNRSNCLFFAIYMKLKFGGEIRIRPSKNTIVYTPHFYWVSKDKTEAWGYSPINPLWPIPWDILWFKGKIISEKENI